MLGKSNRRRRCGVIPVEQLETRRLLSTINWANKGTGAGAGDTDSFNAIYGANAAVARNIVQRAVDDWERVIVNFNYTGGGNTYTVNISAAAFTGGLRGSTSPPSRNNDTQKKPISTTIQIDDNGGGTGWYFDPVIGTAAVPDDSEFTTFLTPFDSDAPGVGGFDFYRTTLHELGHAMGLFLDTSGFYRISDFTSGSVGTDPVDGSSTLHTINTGGGPVDYTITSSGGGHLFEGGGSYSGPTHPNQLMNAGRAVPTGTRRLINDVEARLLRDVYGYTIAFPSTINTFYANLNTATNVLTVRGNNGSANDELSINESGGIFIAVNGTSETIPAAEVNSIIVNAGAGNDTVRVLDLGGTEPVTVNADDGNDFIDVGNGDYDTNISSNIVVNGGTGTDSIVVNDITDGPGSDSAEINSGSFVKQFGGTLSWSTLQMESFAYLGTPNDDTIFLNSAASTMSYSISGLAGNDTLNVTTADDVFAAVAADVSFSGGTGTDVVNISDAADTGTDTYQISGNQFQKTVGGGTGSITATSSTESMIVSGGIGTNTWSVPQLSSFLDLSISGGAGTDNFTGFFGNDFASNVTSTINFDGGGGTDRVTVNDQGSTGLDYFLSLNSFDKGGSGEVNYTNCEGFVLNCNAGDNDITLFSTHSSSPVTINGNSGDDQLLVNDGSSFLFNFGSDITFNGGVGGTDQISVNDSGFGGTGTYTVVNGQVILPFNGADVFHSNTEQILISASQGNNIINVNQTNIDIFAIGDGGNDTINIGGGDFDTNITAGVLPVGGDGSDIAFIQDTASTEDAVWTITNLNTTKSTATGSVLTSFFGILIDALRIDAGSGSETFNINALGSATTPMNLSINAGDGNDTFNVADGTFADMFGAITVQGQGGTDAVVINDLADTGTDTYTLTNSLFGKSDWAFAFSYFLAESLRLDASNANGTIDVTATNLATSYRLNGNGGTDTYNVFGTNTNGVIVDGGAGLDFVNVNPDESGTATVTFDSDQDLATLSMFIGSTVNVIPDGDIGIDAGLTGTVRGILNLNDNFLITATSLPFMVDKLARGYNGGAWNGVPAGGNNGVVRSQTAAASAASDGLGYAEIGAAAGQLNIAVYRGVAVGVGDKIISYTLNGDNDLNRIVNINDFALLAANFNTPNTNWVRGNSNYDLITDIADFALQASNFNQSIADLPRAASASGGGLFNELRISPADPLEVEQSQFM